MSELNLNGKPSSNCWDRKVRESSHPESSSGESTLRFLAGDDHRNTQSYTWLLKISLQLPRGKTACQMSTVVVTYSTLETQKTEPCNSFMKTCILTFIFSKTSANVFVPKLN